MSWIFSKSKPSRAPHAAFEILVREHHRGLLSYARSLAPDSGVAEDLVQDAFVVAWRKLEQFDASRDFGAWIRGIIRFEYLHWARKRKEVPLEDEILDRLDAMHLEVERAKAGGADVISVVRTCVAELPQAMRDVVNEVYQVGLSCVEIAERCGLSETAVRKRLQRGRDAVGKCVAGKLELTEVL